MKTFRVLVMCVLLCLFAVPAMAQIDSFFDVFWAGIGGDSGNWNQLDPALSGGSGYPSLEGGPNIGEWYPYDAVAGTVQTDRWGNQNPNPSWRNQWFYDGRFRPERYKIVDVSFTYQLLDPLKPGGTEIVINWSTPEWSLDPAHAGAPPMSNQDPDSGLTWIGRAVVGGVWLEPGEPNGSFSGTFDLRDFGCPYNPEWVSIDVAGYNVLLSSQEIPGSFRHYCVPEPGTLMLLVTAGIGVLLCAWRKRRGT